MELMERVREIGADAPALPDAGVDAARVALLREIAREERTDAAPRRHRAARWVGGSALVGGLAAAALVTALAVAPVVAPVEAPGAAAADVFEQAALGAATAEDPVLAPGQYLRIETTRDYFVSDAQLGGSGARAAGSAFTYREVDLTYVPADRTQEWVFDYSTPTEITGTFGPDGDELRERVFAGYDYRTMDVEHVPGYTDPAKPFDLLHDYYDVMPRDPRALLDWIRTEGGPFGPVPEGYESKALLDAIYLNLPPADLRATILEALALIPGFDVVARDGSLATLEAVSESGDGKRIVVDVDRGTVTSMAQLATDTERGSLVPAGTPTWSSTTHTTVVDAAP